MNYKQLSLIFTLSFFLVLFLGCSKDDDNTILEESEPYVLEDIQWILKEGDRQETIEKELPEQLFKNKGDTTMRVAFNPLKDLKGSSHFQFELPENLSLNMDSLSQVVSVTSHIKLLSDSYSHLGGGTKVPFQQGESSFPFSFSTEESIDLKPGTQINYQSTLILNKNTATFKARFVQPLTRDSYELMGKWTGIFYQSLKTNVVIEDID